MTPSRPATVIVDADTCTEKPPALLPEEVNLNSHENSQQTDFPDGGLRAWGAVFGAFMIDFACYGVIGSFGVFVEYYSVNQLKYLPLSTISWIGSLQSSLILLTGCVSGPLFDAGYLHWMIASAGILYVFCLFMSSISTQFYQFLLSQGLGVGIAMGLLYAPSGSTIAHHFQKYEILAYGIMASGGSVGGIVLPLVMRRLFEQVGLPWALRTLAFIVLFCTICGFVCCSSRLPPRKGGHILDFSVFHDHVYSFFVFGVSIVGLGLYAPVSYGVTYAVAHDVPSALAFYTVSIHNALTVCGRLFANAFAQRVGPLNIFILVCSFSGVLEFVWVAAHSTPGILAFTAVFGFVSGGYVSVIPAAIATLNPDPQVMGLRLGMTHFCASFFWLASAPIQGALIRLNGTYWPTAVFSGSAVFAGMAMMVVARVLVGRKTNRRWV
ncbi:major facilitator superfamily domain-containing protein [Mycena epipterygia]|nr:major facilitator superfamily domain-containing protein [Mycena epipterygia]